MVRTTLKLAAVAFLFANSAAALAETGKNLCSVAPAQIAQAAALKAGTAEARKALYNANTAAKLCDAGAKDEAARKFKIAYSALGLDYAAALAQAGGLAN